MRRLDIVGAGAVGRTLGRLWHEAGALRVGHVLNRSRESAQAAVDFIGAGEAGVELAGVGTVECLMLSVADDAIEACAARLAGSGVSLRGAIVFHCSGASSAEALAPLRDGGAHVASLHPVKTFADPAAAVASFSGTHCGLEGDAEALAVLRPLVARIGGTPFEIDGAQKSLYHAGHVFACNYVTALIEVGLRCHEAAGLSRELSAELLAPLATETVRNAFALGPSDALTGPIARGDARLVERQLAALGASDPARSKLYARLGAVALELARDRGSADPAALDALEAVLAEALREAGSGS